MRLNGDKYSVLYHENYNASDITDDLSQVKPDGEENHQCQKQRIAALQHPDTELTWL